MTKIAFRLSKDTDGYPPVDVERLWAQPLEADSYQIDNIPFFVRGVSCGDIVRAEWKENELMFLEVVRASGHSTLRIVFFDDERVETLRAELKAMECATEASHIPSLISVNVPIHSNLDVILEKLRVGEADNLWSFEEACLRQ